MKLHFAIEAHYHPSHRGISGPQLKYDYGIRQTG
jgi:hypothetical protein